MPVFKGFRVNRTNGAGAGRGDQPYPLFSHPRIPGTPIPLRIDSSRSAPMPPRDTKAARKANSAKAKEKALKSINKSPLTPDDSPFSRSGFKRSEAAEAYDSARYAEQRLQEDKYGPLIHKTAKEFKQTDEDIVGTYTATGKSVWSDEGQKWIGERDLKKKRDEEYG